MKECHVLRTQLHYSGAPLKSEATRAEKEHLH
jgi:hypothetical protein